MKHTSAGRLVALIGGAAIALSACSSTGGATPAPTAAAATPAPTPAALEAPSTPASAPASQAAGPVTVGYLPKDIVNQYFAAAKTGIDKAAGELGGTVTQVGPNEAKAGPPDPVHHGPHDPGRERDHHLGRRQG